MPRERTLVERLSDALWELLKQEFASGDIPIARARELAVSVVQAAGEDMGSRRGLPTRTITELKENRPVWQIGDVFVRLPGERLWYSNRTPETIVFWLLRLRGAQPREALRVLYESCSARPPESEKKEPVNVDELSPIMQRIRSRSPERHLAGLDDFDRAVARLLMAGYIEVVGDDNVVQISAIGDFAHTILMAAEVPVEMLREFMELLKARGYPWTSNDVTTSLQNLALDHGGPNLHKMAGEIEEEIEVREAGGERRRRNRYSRHMNIPDDPSGPALMLLGDIVFELLTAGADGLREGELTQRVSTWYDWAMATSKASALRVLDYLVTQGLVVRLVNTVSEEPWYFLGHIQPADDLIGITMTVAEAAAAKAARDAAKASEETVE